MLVLIGIDQYKEEPVVSLDMHILSRYNFGLLEDTQNKNKIDEIHCNCKSYNYT